MPESPASSPDWTFIRGGGSFEITPRRVVRAVLAVSAIILAVVAILTAISADHQNAEQNDLRLHGVTVEATLSPAGCIGISSGTGATIYTYICHATFSYRGHTYDDVLRGTTSVPAPNSRVKAVTAPDDLSLLSEPAVAARKHSPWGPFVTPIVVGAIAVVLALILLLWPRRRSESLPLGPGEGSADDTTAADGSTDGLTRVACPSCGATMDHGSVRGNEFFSDNGGRRAAKTRGALRCPACSTVVIPGS